MEIISPHFFEFYRQLQQNNSSDWFKANQKSYEEFVKHPFLKFVEVLIEKLQEKVYPTFKIPAKDLIYRINRDIRFTKDKTPYKIFSGAHLNPKGKVTEFPGLYLQMGADGCFFGGGCYYISPPALNQIRQEIAYQTDEWYKILEDKNFKDVFGTVHGVRTKTMPRNFKEETCEWLKNKQFYLWKEIPEEDFLSTEIISTLKYYAETAIPFLRFLETSFN
ncbi:MAG: DUF2461 domain-containing protein [Bacteroidia bacterium]|nr:DUF2461 domain-containing protein [Bacteroidia bacterium]